MQWRSCVTLLVGEVGVGIELVIAQKLPQAAMQCICARLLHQIGDRTGAIAVLCRLVQRQQLEFLNGIFDRSVLRTTAQSLIRCASDKESVEVFAQSVDDGIVTI